MELLVPRILQKASRFVIIFLSFIISLGAIILILSFSFSFLTKLTAKSFDIKEGTPEYQATAAAYKA